MYNNRSFNIALVFSLLVGFVACEGEEESLEWVPGQNLHIIGDEGALAGAVQSFRVDGFTVDKTYTWTLDNSPLEPVRGGETVEVTFPEPGEYQIAVTDGTYDDTLTVTAEAVTLAFDGNASTESEATDTVGVPIVLPAGIESSVTVNYTLGGTAVEGEDYLLLSDNPLVVPAGEDVANVTMVLLNDLMMEEGETVTVTINTISASNTTGGVVLDDSVELRTYTLTIEDDVKYVTLSDTETDSLSALADAGVYPFNVALSAESAADVTVPYVVAGSGVNDLTEGEVTFSAGETISTLVIELEETAFAADQTVTITLGDPISSDDEEVMYEMDEMDMPVGTIKTIVIEAP